MVRGEEEGTQPMARIVMLIHEEAGQFGASFPDFPGATTVASDLDALYRKAGEMIAFHVGGMIEDGAAVPVVRSLDAWRRDATFREDAAGAVIGLIEIELPGKAVRVNISLEETLLKRIDRAAEAVGESRSGFLAQAAKARLAAA